MVIVPPSIRRRLFDALELPTLSVSMFTVAFEILRAMPYVFEELPMLSEPTFLITTGKPGLPKRTTFKRGEIVADGERAVVVQGSTVIDSQEVGAAPIGTNNQNVGIVGIESLSTKV